MKQFKFSIAWLAMFALIFTSCSKEESDLVNDDQELIQLSFGSILNDFKNQNKQATSVECSEDGTPDYVMIGITDSNGDYIGDDGGTSDVNLIELDLKYNAGLEVWETMYSPELALPAGNYTLQYFIVHGTDDEVLWVAPRTGGAFAGDVGTPLPQPITLAAGTKPYITVDVLCYEAREEVAYGYLFFDINTETAENSYCVFVNYCDDVTGREYPAKFTLEVWSDGYGGDVVVNSGSNTTTIPAQGWPSASVLCLALPEITGDDLYARITVMDDGQAYTPGGDIVKEFRISQADIDAIANQTPGYDHWRLNCDEDDDNGGGGDEDCQLPDPCTLDSGTLGENCFYTELEGADNNGWLRIDNAQDLVGLDLEVDFPIDGFLDVASVNITLHNDKSLSVSLDTDEDATDRIIAYAIQVRPFDADDNDMMSDTCWEFSCETVDGNDQLGVITEDFEGYDYSYPFFVKIDASFCFTPIQ